jgi:hypothetical protein
LERIEGDIVEAGGIAKQVLACSRSLRANPASSPTDRARETIGHAVGRMVARGTRHRLVTRENGIKEKLIAKLDARRLSPVVDRFDW